MRNVPPERARWLRFRIGFLAVLLLAGAGSIVRRAWQLQIERGPALRELAEQQYLREVRLTPKRGAILDRNGAELAISVDVDSVWANPRQLRASGWTPEQATEALARVFDLNAETIATRLASDRYFVWIQRRITPQQAAAVRALAIPGVAMSKEARRFYPNRDLAAHVLGFANVDGVGIEGLELTLETHLGGTMEAVPAIRDRGGRVVFSELLFNDRAAQGDDVELTIDKTIQRVAERELELAIRTFEAKSGSVVVMDARDGEILAIANYPTFNANEPNTATAAGRRNRAVTDVFEPGSTVKPFTVAGALAVGAVKPDQNIDCGNGKMVVTKHTIHDTHRWEALTPAGILKHSSNIGTAKIAVALGRPGLYRTLRRFGFGQQTGIPLPGETAGLLRHYKKWYDMDAATISFGQGMSVTALQMTLAMGAIANGGRLVRPLLVKRIVNARGESIEQAQPELRRQVIPRWAARLVGDMLTTVTEDDGTGSEAAIDGHLVAGKTGTAQKADYRRGGYAKDKWTASFVGFVPAQAPRLVISVTIDEPIIAHYGGTVAGPVFRRVGEAALRHMGVSPARAGSALADYAAAKIEAEAAAKAHAASARAVPGPVTPGTGAPDSRASETAAATSVLAAVATPGANGDGAAEPAVVDVSSDVPDVGGQTARRAVHLLRRAGFAVQLEGSGLVTAQTPKAGSRAVAGSTVQVVLSPPKSGRTVDDVLQTRLLRKPPVDGDERLEGTATASLARIARELRP